MASVFLFSCDPENLPKDLSDLSVVNDTGEQEDIPDKKGDEQFEQNLKNLVIPLP